MKRATIFLVVVMASCGFARRSSGQGEAGSAAPPQTSAVERLILINSLKELESEARKLDAPLARAAALTEIAAAVMKRSC